jgi:hypothetical protein
MKLAKKLKFDTAAVGVYSAEGWHEKYAWNDDKQHEATLRLGDTGRANPTSCGCGLHTRADRGHGRAVLGS